MNGDSEEIGTMKPCFGVSFGWFMEDLIGNPEDRLKCYECPDYDRCQQMALIQSLIQIRYEIRRAAQTVGRAFGGSHSTRPFG
jgi:hypothetical protein